MMNYVGKNVFLFLLVYYFIFLSCTNIQVGQVEIKDSKVSTRVNVTTLDEAWLTIETQFQNHLDHSVKGKLICYLDSLSFSVPVSLKASETKNIQITSEDVHELYLKNPRLWWCTNLGEPELYHLKLEFMVKGEIIDVKELDFPVREVNDCVHRGKKRLSLNGRRLSTRGVKWMNASSTDNLLNDKLKVEYLRGMNINSIVFDDIATVPQHIVGFCNEQGLMILPSKQCMRDTLSLSADSMVNARLAFEKSRIRVSNLVYSFINELLCTDSVITAPAYYDVKRTNLTQQLLYSYKKNTVYFVNDNVTGPVEKKARIAMYDLNSNLLHQALIDFRVESDHSKRIFELDDIVGNVFLSLQLLDNKENEEASNFYCLSENNDPEAFTTLPETRLLITPSLAVVGETLQLEIEAFNEGDAISLFTNFVLKDEHGNTIYPAFWDDNNLNIVPHAKKKVICSLRISDIQDKQLQLHVSGSNLVEQVFPLSITW